MTTQNLLPDYISAYRKTSSMEKVLVKIHHDILKAFKKQKGVLLVVETHSKVQTSYA